MSPKRFAQAAADARWEELKGHELQPVVRSAGELDGEEIYLEHKPPDWVDLAQREQELLQQQYDYQQMPGLTPTSRYWTERLGAKPPYEERDWVGKLQYDLGNIAMAKYSPIKWITDVFQFAGEEMEHAVGYYYMGTKAGDPWLRSPEARKAMEELNNMRLDFWNGPKHNEDTFWEMQRAGQLTPAQERVGAAWHASANFYEMSGFPAPVDYVRTPLAFLLEMTPFGDTAKWGKEEYEKRMEEADKNAWVGGRIWASVREPWLRVINAFAGRMAEVAEGVPAEEMTIDPELKEILDNIGATWLLEQEQIETLQTRLEDFVAGDYIETFGGLPELMRARQAILAGENPSVVRDAYMDSLQGARFEAEMQDILGQVVMDPLDWVLTIAKPGQILKVLGNAARLQRAAPIVVTAAEDLMGIASKLEDVEDVARISDDIDDLIKWADITQNDDVMGAAKRIQTLVEEGADVADVRAAFEPIKTFADDIGKMQHMNNAERFAMWITGGTLERGGKEDLPRLLKWAETGKMPRSVAWLNPFDDRFIFYRTPASRADEFLNTWYNNAHLLMRMAGQNVDNMVGWLRKGAAGAFGAQLGHMFITPVGRHVQAVFRMMMTGVDELYETWNASAGARHIMQSIADAIGDDIVKVVTTAGADEKKAFALFENLQGALAKIGPDAPASVRALKVSIDKGNFTAQTLADLGKLFKSTPNKIIPYTPDMFRAAVIKLGAETTAELGKLRFGVREANMLEKGANYLKAAESLVLLGGNPLYPMMNLFNNELTIIARGLTGFTTPSFLRRFVPKPFRKFFPTTDDIIRSFGINPARLREGFGIVGVDWIDEVARATTSEDLTVAAELQGIMAGKMGIRAARWGKPGKVAQKFVDTVRNVPDFRKASAYFESMASERAFTNALMKVWPDYWKAGVGYDNLDDFLPGATDRLREIDPRLADAIDDAIRNGRRPEDIAVLRQAENLQWNTRTLIKRTAQRLGVDDTRINNFVTDDVVESIGGILSELGPKATPDEVRHAFGVVRNTVDDFIDEMVESHLPEMVAEKASQVKIDGVNGVIDIYGQMTGDMTNRHIAHMNRLDQQIGNILQMEDPTLRNAAWNSLLQETDRAWIRHWNRQEAAMKGIAQGMRSRGIKVSADYMSSFRAIRNKSTAFIDTRNKAWAKFFEELSAGKYPTEYDRVAAVAAIHETLDSGYSELIELTARNQGVMDATFLKNLKGKVNEDVYVAATEWRTILRDMRQADMESVLEFRRSIRGMSPDDTHVAHMKFHEQRANELGRMQRMEQYGRVMLNGDEQAIQFFRSNAAKRWAAAGDPSGLAFRYLDGETLRGEELSQLAEIVYENADDAQKVRLDEISRLEDEAVAAGQEASGQVQYNLIWEKRQIQDDVIRRMTGQERPRAIVKQQEAYQLADDAMTKNLVRMPDGSHRRGVVSYKQEIGQVDELPEKVYHVTTNPDAIQESGYLKANGGLEQGGLGGGSAERITGVSFSHNRADSVTVQLGLQRQIMAARGEIGFADIQRFAADDVTKIDPEGISSHVRERGILLEGVESAHQRRLADAASRHGIDAAGYEIAELEEMIRNIDPAQYRTIMHETLRDYRGARHSQTLGELQDPVILASDAGLEKFAAMDPAKVEILELDTEMLFHNQNLVLRNVQSNDFLSEVKVYGDVPLSPDRAIPEITGPSWNPPVFEPVVGHAWHYGTGMDEMWFEEGGRLYDMLTEEALKVLDEPNQRWANLPDDLRGGMDDYLNHVTGQMNDARLAAIRHAEGLRDGALLNYSRRYNFDNFLSVVGPYGFWWTHSMGRWALSALETPHMLAAYGKMRDFLHERQGGDIGFPERLRGSVKVNIPWAPSSMGDTYINPLRSFGLPFEQFLYPFEQMSKMAQSEEQGVQNILKQMVEDGQISVEQAEMAMQERDGPIYNQALAIWNQDNEGPNMLDFMQMSVSPHLPITWALNAARGTPEKIGALPPTRTLKHVATMLGIDPGWYDNTIGNARKAMGLPAFDEWEDYRIDRELSNMAAMNEITAEEAQLAMLNRSGTAYETARRRVAEGEAMRFGTRLLGLSMHFYPEGEQKQRELTQDFYNALEIRDRYGNTDVVQEFFEENPEFEARLALFKPPEERTKAFLVDQIWNKWYDSPKQHQDAIKEALGDQFTELFLNKDTRSLDSISTNTLAMWARSMNQKVPNIFSDSDAIPIDFAPIGTANRLEGFYKERQRRFPSYWELQNEYYDLEEGAPRRQYRQTHPALPSYWDWKWDFLYRNPDLAPYIIDDPSKIQYPSERAMEEAKEMQPVFTLREWETMMGTPLYNLVVDDYYGEPMPIAAQTELEELAESLDLTPAEVMSKMGDQLVGQ